MNKHILFFLAKIIALFCRSFALVYVSNLLLDRSKDFSGLCRESIITTLPFALAVLYSDYRQVWKKKSK